MSEPNRYVAVQTYGNYRASSFLSDPTSVIQIPWKPEVAWVATNCMTEGEDAPRFPLNLLDALRAFEADGALTASMGDEFPSAFLKIKREEWNSFVPHFSRWEREHTPDI